MDIGKKWKLENRIKQLLIIYLKIINLLFFDLLHLFKLF